MMTGQSLPDGVTMANQPTLSRQNAFSVVWFLQEHLRILPDNIELCFKCGCLYDADYGGTFINDESWDNEREFYERIGVDQARLIAADGVSFCSTECELSFFKPQ